MRTFNKRELASFLGISTRTVARWVRHRGLPVQVQKNGAYLFCEQEVVEWVRSKGRIL